MQKDGLATHPSWRPDLVGLYWNFSRPFTLVPPMVGIFSGALIGYATTRASFPFLSVVLAIAAAAILNAASNGLNQIFDLVNDRINKSHRPLASGRMTRAEAWRFVVVTYAVALSLASLINWQTFAIYAVAAMATVAYSVPPIRLKQRPWAANLTIALARGELLKVAGWATVATVFNSVEPWYIGFIYFVFLLGATTTKDFADLEGDRASGCLTLPVKYGVQVSVRLISPFFILPWLIMAAGVPLRVLSGSAPAILVLSLTLVVWGCWVVRLINHDPYALVSKAENHPGWRQMYWMMMAGHLGLAGAYLLALSH
ncbi:MAG: UbiA prenyltransferase family protein [Terriglobia bacterium]